MAYISRKEPGAYSDAELLTLMRSAQVFRHPLVAEVVRRFAADFSAADIEEAAWLSQPAPLGLNTDPQPLAWGAAP
jgi:hypothetical protein